jgi:hypothetical protein
MSEIDEKQVLHVLVEFAESIEQALRKCPDDEGGVLNPCRLVVAELVATFINKLWRKEEITFLREIEDINEYLTVLLAHCGFDDKLLAHIKRDDDEQAVTAKQEQPLSLNSGWHRYLNSEHKIPGNGSLN